MHGEVSRRAFSMRLATKEVGQFTVLFCVCVCGNQRSGSAHSVCVCVCVATIEVGQLTMCV